MASNSDDVSFLDDYFEIYIKRIDENKGKTLHDKPIQLTREECEKVAHNPKMFDPTIINDFINVSISKDDTFEINGRLFAPIIGKDNAFICIDKKSYTEKFMCGFSKELSYDNITKSIYDLIKTTDPHSSVEIGGCILKFNRETNEFSITGPSNEKTKKTREIIFTIIKILFKQ